MFALRRYGPSLPCHLSPSLNRLRTIPEIRRYASTAGAKKGRASTKKAVESKDVALDNEPTDSPPKSEEAKHASDLAEFLDAPLKKKRGRPKRAVELADDDPLRSEIAKGLLETEVWSAKAVSGGKSTMGQGRKGGRKKKKGDHTRVNIISDSLCDDSISYLAPSLERHRGCDILDLYPGAGLWSQKLHDAVQPRSHIMLEPDEALYTPFLQPLLDKPGTKLIPKSGIIWRELIERLNPDNFPHQKVPTSEKELVKCNDTLLVTANLAFHPKKKFKGFDSVALLLLHQFISSIRTSSLFQRYGLVRMLVWTRNDDKDAILAKNIQRHRRTSIDTDLYCQWVREVCGGGAPDWFMRDQAIDRSVARRVMTQMREDHISVPPTRISDLLAETRAAAKTTFKDNKESIPEPGTVPPLYARENNARLAILQEAHEKGLIEKADPEYRDLLKAKWRQNSEDKRLADVHRLMLKYDELVALHAAGQTTDEDLERMERELKVELDEQPKSNLSTWYTSRDNLHAIRQDPPFFHWDRRPYEPLRVEANEFLPAIECTLLDIQPKAPHPLLRQVGPGSNRAGDVMDLVMSTMMSQSSQTLPKVLDGIWPGAADFIMPRWKSIRDLKRGGVPKGKFGWFELTPRMLNARQWEELAELWVEWPFKPEYHELVGRTNDDDTTPDETMSGGAGTPGML